MKSIHLYIAFIILAILTLVFHKVLVPYIRRQHEKGNPKYADEDYTEKIIKRLSLIGNIIWILALIALAVDSEMKYGFLSH